MPAGTSTLFDFAGLSSFSLSNFSQYACTEQDYELYNTPHSSPPPSESSGSTGTTGTYATALASTGEQLLKPSGLLGDSFFLPPPDTAADGEVSRLFEDFNRLFSGPALEQPTGVSSSVPEPTRLTPNEAPTSFYQSSQVNPLTTLSSFPIANPSTLLSIPAMANPSNVTQSSHPLLEYPFGEIPVQQGTLTWPPVVEIPQPSQDLFNFNFGDLGPPLIDSELSLDPQPFDWDDPAGQQAPVPARELEEDPGNEADTESESLPFFRARRSAPREYSGNSLVSREDIQRTATGPQMQRTTPSNADGCPRRRAGWKNRLSKQLRRELASLLGMDAGKTVVDVCQALSNNDLNTFKTIWNATSFHHLHPSCCDIDNFFIDLVNPPHSAWNESASRVFTVHFIKKFKLSQSDDMKNEVREAFFTRIKSLRSDLRKLQAGKEAVELSLQATRRWLRKQTSFYQRLAATAHPLFQRFRPIVICLGVAGMSTDESDQEMSNHGRNMLKTYHVRVPIYRVYQLTPCLRWLDKIYLIMRRMSKTLRGALPRVRIAPDMDTELAIRAQAYANLATSRARFVNDLPKCAYDTTWFAFFVGNGFDLRYTNEEYNFTLDLELLDFYERHQSFNVPRNALSNVTAY